MMFQDYGILQIITSGTSYWSEEKQMFYLTTHSTHFIYGYMSPDISQRNTQRASEETRCRHIGYSLRLPTRVLLYPSRDR